MYKNEHLPTHNLHIGQDIMYQNVASRWWHPGPLQVYVCSPEFNNITTRDDVTYRKTQAHLRPYQHQCKKTEDEHSDSDMWTAKANLKQFG